MDRVWRCLLAGIGFTPIALLCVALLGWLPLHLTAPVIGGPAMVLLALVCFTKPEYRFPVWRGWIAGVVACLFYDFTRVLFVLAGLWTDFVPEIGYLMMNDQSVHPGLGYLWRLAGNGGGMGIAFSMWAGPRGVQAGTVYGMLIWSCLIATLVASPLAQRLLFPLKPLPIIASLIGHFQYGTALGWLMQYWEHGVGFRRHAKTPEEPHSSGMPATSTVT